MAYNDITSLRVVVSGIMRRPVQRCGKGIVQEDDLLGFFHDAGCKVAAVRLVIDAKRGERSRGFGFVDFEDCESLDLALKLHNTEAAGLADKDGKLRIQMARAATYEGRKKQREPSDARNPSVELEQKLAFHAARLNELVRDAMLKQLSSGANQGNGSIAALTPATFEPPVCKKPAHEADPNPRPDSAESTANNQERVAIEDDLSQSIPHVISRGSPTSGIASSPATEVPPAVKTDDEPAPWVLKRELGRRDSFSAADVSRALQKQKMSGQSSTDGSTDGSMDGSMDGSTAATSEQESMAYGPSLGDVVQDKHDAALTATGGKCGC